MEQSKFKYTSDFVEYLEQVELQRDTFKRAYLLEKDKNEKLRKERDQLKEEHQLMKSFLEQLVQWNSHGYVRAKEILDILNQKPQEY